MDHHCECEAAGSCPLFRRVMNKREHDICRGYDQTGNQSIAEDRRALHIKKWIEAAGDSVGLGDYIRKLTSTVGIPHCGACSKRQVKLNKASPSGHWLTRIAKTIIDRFTKNRPVEPLRLPSFSFNRWTVDTSKVSPQGITDPTADPFPYCTEYGIELSGGSTKPPPSFVWVYWKNGAESDEIEFSIASVVNFVPDAEIVICGDRPDWYDGKFIPSKRVTVDYVEARYGYTPSKRWLKWIDSIVKLEAIIDSDLVSDDFLWMYDDTFITQPTTFEQLAIPRHGASSIRAGKDVLKHPWREVRRRTFKELSEAGLPTADYSTHFPTAYNKQKLRATINRFRPWKNPRLIESLYLNHHNLNGSRSVGSDLTYVKSNSLKRLSRDNHYVINIGHGAWESARARVAAIIGIDGFEPATAHKAEQSADQSDEATAIDVGCLAAVAIVPPLDQPGFAASNARRFVEYFETLPVDLFYVEQSGTQTDSEQLQQLVEQLPESCTAIAFVEPDIEFDSADWPYRALSGLLNRSAVQLCDSVAVRMPSGRNQTTSIRLAAANGDEFGIGWAVRREVIESDDWFSDHGGSVVESVGQSLTSKPGNGVATVPGRAIRYWSPELAQ